MKGREFRGVWNEKMRRMWLEREIVVADPFPSLISINRLYKLILQRLINIYLVHNQYIQYIINIYLVHNKREDIQQKIIVAKIKDKTEKIETKLK